MLSSSPLSSSHLRVQTLLLQRMRRRWRQPAKKIVILGLDWCGKTTLLYRIKLASDTAKKSNQPQNQPLEALHTIATLGFNVESFEFKERIRFIAWEIGGSQPLLWRYYYPNTDFIIYVIDSTDRERLSSSSATLNGVFEDELLPKYPKAPPLLVFANRTARVASRWTRSRTGLSIHAAVVTARR